MRFPYSVLGQSPSNIYLFWHENCPKLSEANTVSLALNHLKTVMVAGVGCTLSRADACEACSSSDSALLSSALADLGTRQAQEAAVELGTCTNH